MNRKGRREEHEAGGVVDERYLFFRPQQCTGCRICQMACALQNAGRCQETDSRIRVLRHPRFGTSVVAVRPDCRRCERCVQACNMQAIRFAGEPEWGELLRNGWLASPVLEG